MLSTETLLESSTGMSKSNSSRTPKPSLKQQISTASSNSSTKTTPLLASNALSASSSKKKGIIINKTSQSKVSPRSGSSSLTSEIPCFDLNSCYDVGSSTSASNNNNNNNNNNQLVSLKSPSSSQKPMIDFSPVLQPCEDPLTQFQFSHSQPLFPVKSSEEFTRIDLPSRLIHWNLLPAEIQKAVLDLDGQVDELQQRFEEYVPFIEPHFDSRLALSKVMEAQRFQESQVFKLTNQKEGVTLQSAVNNLIKQQEQGNIYSHNTERCMYSLVKKSKKIRKCSSGKTTASSQRTTQQRESYPDCDEKYNSSPRDKLSVSKTVGMKYSSIQGNNMHQSGRADLSEIPGQFQGNHNPLRFSQQQESQQQCIPYKVNTTFSAMSPRKAVYDDEIMNQSEFNGTQQQMNNQYDDFSGLTKLRRYQSDPFGYSYFNQQNFINSNPSNHHHNHLNTHTDELEGELQMVYQEESIFDGILHHQQQNCEDHQLLQQPALMESFKKDDEDDTLNGAYHSQNDTFEELINQQSKCCSQNGYQAKTHDNIYCQSAPNIPTISQSNNNFSYLNDSSPCHQQQHGNIRSFPIALHSYTTEFYSQKPQIHKEFDFPQETSDNMFGGIL